jgi:hypothetical protein
MAGAESWVSGMKKFKENAPAGGERGKKKERQKIIPFSSHSLGESESLTATP